MQHAVLTFFSTKKMQDAGEMDNFAVSFLDGRNP